jgi:transcriptional regulatory protein LevR
MQAKYIATFRGFTTSQNRTTTVNYLLEVEGNLYLVEMGSLDHLESAASPRKVVRLEVQQEVAIGSAVQEAILQAKVEVTGP